MSNDERRFYIYAFLRSVDSQCGKKGSPYYIGKGSGKRAWSKNRRIQLPVDKKKIVFLRAQLTEQEAFDWECIYIAHYGRIDLGTGILRNQSNGGEGASGMIHSEEARLKISRANKGKVVSMETKEKIRRLRQKEGRWKGCLNPTAGGDLIRRERNPMWGKNHSPEAKSKISEKQQAYRATPEGKTMGKLKSQKYLYELIDPSGEVYVTENLFDFSKQYELINSCLNKVVNGSAKQHKGWTGRIVEKLK